jgi:chaperonin GroES
MSANKTKNYEYYDTRKEIHIMLKPLEDHVIVEPIEQEEKTSSGIYLPDTAHKDKPQTGTVIAIGTGRLLDNGQRVQTEVKVGEKVVFAKYAGSDVELDDKKYVILKDSDILAVISDDKKAKKAKK